MEVIEIAEKAFGIVLTEELAVALAIDSLYHEEDALVRVVSIVQEDEVIVVQDYEGAEAYITYDELENNADALKTQWRQLTLFDL